MKKYSSKQKRSTLEAILNCLSLCSQSCGNDKDSNCKDNNFGQVDCKKCYYASKEDNTTEIRCKQCETVAGESVFCPKCKRQKLLFSSEKNSTYKSQGKDVSDKDELFKNGKEVCEDGKNNVLFKQSKDLISGQEDKSTVTDIQPPGPEYKQITPNKLTKLDCKVCGFVKQADGTKDFVCSPCINKARMSICCPDPKKSITQGLYPCEQCGVEIKRVNSRTIIRVVCERCAEDIKIAAPPPSLQEVIPLQKEPSSPRVSSLQKEPSSPRVSSLQKEPSSPRVSSLQKEPSLQREPSPQKVPSLQKRSIPRKVTFLQEPSSPSVSSLQKEPSTQREPSPQKVPSLQKRSIPRKVTFLQEPSSPSVSSLQKEPSTQREPSPQKVTFLQKEPSLEEPSDLLPYSVSLKWPRPKEQPERFLIQLQENSPKGVWKTVQTLPGNLHPLLTSVTDLKPGLFYAFRVKAEKNKKSEPIMCQVTTSQHSKLSGTLGPVTATDITTTSIVLHWNEPMIGGVPEAYLLEKQLHPDGRWELVCETPRDRNIPPSIIINSLEPGTSYNFRVIAKFSFSDSPPTQTEEPITTLRLSQVPPKELRKITHLRNAFSFF